MTAAQACALLDAVAAAVDDEAQATAVALDVLSDLAAGDFEWPCSHCGSVQVVFPHSGLCCGLCGRAA